ncbi:MAG: squalene synthase HpnC [Solirubrobacterales bacterium]
MSGGATVEVVETPGHDRPGAPDGVPGLEEVMARARGENFPVASRLLGSRLREPLLAIYGFARLVDQIGDESTGDRPALLAWLDSQVDVIYEGGMPDHPALRRMAIVVRQAEIPPEPLHKLVEANRVDQTTSSYATFESLLGYCELSANPVGHMVLCVFGAATPDRLELSDAVCSALQVTEHLQDIREDLSRGRVYLPQEDLARFGCDASDLTASPTPERVRTLIAFEVERARALFDRGAPLVARLSGRPRLAVTAFIAGGRAALAAIEHAGYEFGPEPPRPTMATRALSLARTARAPR